MMLAVVVEVVATLFAMRPGRRMLSRGRRHT